MTTLKKLLNGASLQDKYIPDFNDLKKIVDQAKAGGFKISLTQGVYDMFHVGHGRYLAEARSHGDLLVVGVDSDELTRSMKGPDRPYDDFDQRIEVLSMLSSVSIIARRDMGQGKYDLIKLVKPDVLIMSQTTKSFTARDIKALEKSCGEIRHLEAKAATTTTARSLRLRREGINGLEKLIKADTEDFAAKLTSRFRDHLEAVSA